MHLDVLIEQRALIKGDARSVSIAAASIIAKVARDARLEELDKLYPQYGLARNKGYGTADHLEALRRHGATPLHRFSFGESRSSWMQNPAARGALSICHERVGKEREWK